MPTRDASALLAALAEQVVRSARLCVYALKADKEGRAHNARLFRALSRSANVQAWRLLLLLRGKSADTEANLAETKEAAATFARETLPGLRATARGEGDTLLDSLLEHLEGAAASQLELLDAPAQDGTFAVCTICGYVVAGDAPEYCPVCTAVREKFATPDDAPEACGPSFRA